MISFEKMFQNIAESVNAPVVTDAKTIGEPEVCYEHLRDKPCAICAEDSERGYEVRILAGRCANGSELGSGTKWHAVLPGKHSALCGAMPGRRSVGWSTWRKTGQGVTCPKCQQKLSHNKNLAIQA